MKSSKRPTSPSHSRKMDKMINDDIRDLQFKISQINIQKDEQDSVDYLFLIYQQVIEKEMQYQLTQEQKLKFIQFYKILFKTILLQVTQLFKEKSIQLQSAGKLIELINLHPLEMFQTCLANAQAIQQNINSQRVFRVLFSSFLFQLLIKEVSQDTLDKLLKFYYDVNEKRKEPIELTIIYGLETELKMLTSSSKVNNTKISLKTAYLAQLQLNNAYYQLNKLDTTEQQQNLISLLYQPYYNKLLLLNKSMLDIIDKVLANVIEFNEQTIRNEKRVSKIFTPTEIQIRYAFFRDEYFDQVVQIVNQNLDEAQEQFQKNAPQYCMTVVSNISQNMLAILQFIVQCRQYEQNTINKILQIFLIANKIMDTNIWRRSILIEQDIASIYYIFATNPIVQHYIEKGLVSQFIRDYTLLIEQQVEDVSQNKDQFQQIVENVLVHYQNTKKNQNVTFYNIYSRIQQTNKQDQYVAYNIVQQYLDAIRQLNQIVQFSDDQLQNLFRTGCFIQIYFQEHYLRYMSIKVLIDIIKIQCIKQQNQYLRAITFISQYDPSWKIRMASIELLQIQNINIYDQNLIFDGIKMVRNEDIRYFQNKLCFANTIVKFLFDQVYTIRQQALTVINSDLSTLLNNKQLSDYVYKQFICKDNKILQFTENYTVISQQNYNIQAELFIQQIQYSDLKVIYQNLNQINQIIQILQQVFLLIQNSNFQYLRILKQIIFIWLGNIQQLYDRLINSQLKLTQGQQQEIDSISQQNILIISQNY